MLDAVDLARGAQAAALWRRDSQRWQNDAMVLSPDTTPDADEVQLEAYRRMGGPGRAAIMFRLNELSRQATIAGIRSRHPDYTDEELRLAFARLVLGDDCVRAVWPGSRLVAP